MPLTDNIVSYWKLEEASGTRADETTTNALTDNATVTSNTGKLGTAAQLTRANSEYLSHADHASLSPGDTDFTFAAWVYLDSDPAGNMGVVCKSESLNGEYFLYYDGVNDRFKWEVYGGAAFTNGHALTANTLGAPSTGTWYYLVAWHDATNNLIGLSINDVAETPVSHTGGIYDSTGVFAVGHDTFSGYFDGRIDGVGYWARKLAAQDMTDLYNANAGLEYPFAGGAAVVPQRTLVGVGV